MPKQKRLQLRLALFLLATFTGFLCKAQTAQTPAHSALAPSETRTAQKPVVPEWKSIPGDIPLVFGPKPRMWSQENKACYIYDKYVVISIGIETDDSVSVFAIDSVQSDKTSKDKAHLDEKSLCGLLVESKSVKPILTTGDGHFNGIDFPYYFLDEGTSSSRSVIIYNLETRKKIADYDYYEMGKPFKFRQGILTNELTMVPMKEVDKLKSKPSCPKRTKDQEATENYGWQETFVGSLAFDLKKNTKTYNNIHCELHYFE